MIKTPGMSLFSYSQADIDENNIISFNKKTASLMSHISNDYTFPDEDGKGVAAIFANGKIDAKAYQDEKFAWFTLPSPKSGWNLGLTKSIQTEITNTGTTTIKLLVWVNADHGWDAVCDEATLLPNETKLFTIDLRESFSDGTPKINPNRVEKIQYMLLQAKNGDAFTVKSIQRTETTVAWKMPQGRLEIPIYTEEPPTAGKRVKHQSKSMIGSERYAALYLPIDWQKGKQYPIIVEFPGNIWFTIECYSTGLPEDCAIGYGMSRGEGAIWVSMPFLDKKKQKVINSGFGNPDYTAQVTIEIVNEIIATLGGDKNNLFITGFSRGAIACDFIGFINPEIASIWKGAHACQHYDGDDWNGATMKGAKERIKHFKGTYFQTDNNEHELKETLEVAGVQATFVSSGLGAHATAMFLDNRESTLKLRNWFNQMLNIN